MMNVEIKAPELEFWFNRIYKEDIFHGQFAPIKLSVEMINKLEGKVDWSTAEIAVLYDLSLLMVVCEKVKTVGGNFQNITYFCSFDEKKRFAEALGVKVEYKEQGVMVHWLKGKHNMKFNVVLGNPPYLRGLHLKFLSLSYDLLSDDGKLIFVHPSDFLILLRDGKTKQQYDKIKNQIANNFSSIDFINASEYFDIGMYMPLSITFIDKSKTDVCVKFNGNNVNSINDINLIGDIDTIKSIEKKLQKVSNIKDLIRREQNNFYVNLSSLVGNGSMTVVMFDKVTRTHPNKFNLVNNTWNKVTTKPGFAKSQKGELVGNEKPWISFETEELAHNFLNVITKSKLIKYLLLTYNIDQNIDSCFYLIPFIDWKVTSDRELYDYFNLTQNEIDLIERTVK